MKSGFGLLAVVPLCSVAFGRSGYKFEHPKYVPEDISLQKGSFYEDFQIYKDSKDLLKTWTVSQVELGDESSLAKQKQYPVQWGVEEAYVVPGFLGDKSLVTYSDSGMAMIARILDEPIEVGENADLVVQYEVKMQTSLECGGAFLKLFSTMNKSVIAEYGKSKHPVMELVFGPDKCHPYVDEIHLGVKKTNPKSGDLDLKLLADAPKSQLGEDLKSHLYTLVLRGSTQDYEIRFDGKVLKAGSMLADKEFSPGFGAPKTIPDSNAKKPETWDDRKLIMDPNEKKPEDWEDNPTIPDPEHTKPATWDSSVPEMIIDESYTKPEWWDDKVDGVWVKKYIRNPACDTETGCGEWKQRQLRNPKYKGQWQPKMISNPDYMGVWEAPHIENPNYYEDKYPTRLENAVGTVMFEFWSGSSDMLIDNIYVGKSVEEAEQIGNKTFVQKRQLEDKEIELGGGQPRAKAVQSTGIYEQVKQFVLGLPSVVQGFLLGLISISILLLSSAYILKIVIWNEERKARQAKLEKAKQAKEKPEEVSEKEPIAEAATTTGTETRTKSKIVSRHVVQLESNDDDVFEEELDVSIVEQQEITDDDDESH